MMYDNYCCIASILVSFIWLMASEGSNPVNSPGHLIAPSTAPAKKRIARKQDTKICCFICNKSRCLDKYRRHLLGHIKSGELSADSINPILHPLLLI